MPSSVIVIHVHHIELNDIIKNQLYRVRIWWYYAYDVRVKLVELRH